MIEMTQATLAMGLFSLLQIKCKDLQDKVLIGPFCKHDGYE